MKPATGVVIWPLLSRGRPLDESISLVRVSTEPDSMHYPIRRHPRATEYWCPWSGVPDVGSQRRTSWRISLARVHRKPPSCTSASMYIGQDGRSWNLTLSQVRAGSGCKGNEFTIFLVLSGSFGFILKRTAAAVRLGKNSSG